MRKKSKSRSKSRSRRDKSSRRSRSRGRRGRRSRSRSRGRRRSTDRKKSSRRSRDKSPEKSSSRGVTESGGTGSTKMDEDSDAKKKRKSRWGAQDDLEFIPGMPVTLPPNLTDEQQRLYLIHVKIEETNKKLKSGDFSSEITRSPSPEPIYNSEGKRLNTREFRIRKKLEDERQALIQEAMRLNPSFKPAGGEVPQVRHQEKVMIPVMANPNVNFMGLLIGPRGNSLKKLEEETNTKIMIRGKGSVKEGKGRKDGQPMPGEDEDLHALISAPTEQGLHNAIKKITSIINDAIQSPDNTNELKKLQMRELALLNGTLRDEDLLKCRNCGALDHRDWECQGEKNVTQQITCERCGGGGHLATDCQVDLTNSDNFIPDKAKMDSEYMSLMAELGVAEEGAGLSTPSNAPPPGIPGLPANIPPPPAAAPPVSGPPGGFAPRQANVLGAPRPRYPGLGSDGRFNSPNNMPNNMSPMNPGNMNPGNMNPRNMNPGNMNSGNMNPENMNNSNMNNNRDGNSDNPRDNNRGGGPGGPRGGGSPNNRGGFQGNRPPWQTNNPGGGPPNLMANVNRGMGPSGPPRGGFNNRGGFGGPRGGNNQPPRGPAPWQQPNNFGPRPGGFSGFPPPPVNIPSTKPPPPPEDPPESSTPNPWEQNTGGWGMMPPPVMPPWMAGSMPGVRIPQVPPAPPSQPPPPQ